MKSLLRMHLLLIHACVVLAESIDGVCKQLHDGIECFDTSDEELYDHDYAGVQDAHELDRSQPKLHLSVVACGDRLNETVVMLKSAVLFSDEPFHVHIFADEELWPQFQHQLSMWPKVARSHMTFTLYPIQFPEGPLSLVWKELFKLCASQRMFIPEILQHIDAVLYVDTDVLFLRPLDDVWHFFDKFSDTQIAALAPEHEEPTASWYARFASHPYVPPYGVNSGVMLMNLTRMRECFWTKQMVSYYEKYRYKITWGDQDLINIFFHFFPDKLYQYSCEWNYRPDHCMYMSNCRSAEQHGISMLHGCRRAFHNDNWPIFRAVYQTIEHHKFSDDLHKLLQDMKTNIEVLSDGKDRCHRVAADLFTKQIDARLQHS